MTQQCEYCKSSYPKSDFRVLGSKDYSKYCKSCRDMIDAKVSNSSYVNFARELTPYEIELQENFLRGGR